MTTISIYDYEIRNDSISITRLDQHFTEADVNDFFVYGQPKTTARKAGWSARNKIVIPNPTPHLRNIWRRGFHKRFQGDYFNDLLLEYASEADLKWEEPWFPPQVDEAEEDAWRDFRNQCGV